MALYSRGQAGVQAQDAETPLLQPKVVEDEGPVRIPCLEVRIPRTAASLICVAGSVVGGVTQNVALPLWLVALGDAPAGPNPFFVLVFASLAYVVIFGGVVVYQTMFTNLITQVERTFPHRYLALIGVCDALNGVLVVFASPPDRTAPFLQAILGNSIIPFTMIGSYFILHRKTTWKHVGCASLCVLGLLIALAPTILNLDNVAHRYSESNTARYVWPLVFMFGFLPAAAMNIYEEKVLKTVVGADSLGQLNLVYMLFWTSLYQLLAAILMFWAAIIPGFGVSTASAFPNSMWENLSCNFGGQTCSWAPFFFVVFVAGYTASYLFGGWLFRHASANYQVVATSLVTPLGALWWTCFNANPFRWEVQSNPTTWFSLVAIPILLAGIVGYHKLEQAAHGEQEVDIDQLDPEHGIYRTLHPDGTLDERDYHTI